jgi:hypothetical protein
MNSAATLPPAAPAPAGAFADFPDWLPPMLVKELRQGLRARGFVALFVVFHVIAVLAFWWTLEINSASGSREIFNYLNGLFWGLVNLVLLLALPWRGLSGLRSEMDGRTLDLLVLTRLTAWRIVLGKWVALSAQAVLFLLTLLPYGVVRYFFGSVDLLGDLGLVGTLVMASFGLTAATLWVSTLPKIVRILVPVLMVFGAQGFGITTITRMTMASRPGVTMSPARFPPVMDGWGVLATALLIVVCLGLAVRRLAPPAENHSQWARGLLMTLLLLAVPVGWFVSRLPLVPLGFFAVLFVGALELSRDCLPMAVHWRSWRARGRWGAFVGRFALPGWPSAMRFAALALAMLTVLQVVMPRMGMPGVKPFLFAWWMVLAWQALVLPSVLLSFLPESSSLRLSGGGYFVVQGLFGIMSMLSVTNGATLFASTELVRLLDTLCQILPVSSFWLTGAKLKTGLGTGHIVGQAIMLVLLVWLVRRQSALYWRQLAHHDVFDARAKSPAA